jgi:surfeit locus 1 family protein
MSAVSRAAGVRPHAGRWRAALVLVAAVLFSALCVRLGMWQLDRAAQKLALQARIDERRALPPLGNAELPGSAEAAALQFDRRARVHGHWLAEATVLLDNRQMNGVPGFFVVTPLQLDGHAEAILVERGWAPRDFRDRNALPRVPSAAGALTVEGRIAPPPARLYAFGPEASGPIRQNLDVAAFSREIGTKLLPLALLQVDSAVTAGDGLLRAWPAPALGVETHYGYAGQWFLFASLTIGLYVWFQLVRPHFRAR